MKDLIKQFKSEIEKHDLELTYKQIGTIIGCLDKISRIKTPPPSLEEAARDYAKKIGFIEKGSITGALYNSYIEFATNFASPYAAKAEMLERELEELKRQTITDGYQQVSKRCDYEKRK